MFYLVRRCGVVLAVVAGLVAISCTAPPPTPTPAGPALIRTIAGTGASDSNGDGGPATAAAVQPAGIAVDSVGNVYFAEPGHHRVRKIAPSGVVTTVAGTGVDGTAGVGGTATSAQLSIPLFVDVDGNGNLYIGEDWFSGGGRVLKVNGAGVISEIPPGVAFEDMAVDASGAVYLMGYDQAFGPYVIGAPSTYDFTRGPCPGYTTVGTTQYGLAVDSARNVFVSENPDYDCDDTARVFRATPAGGLAVVAGVGPTGFSGDGGQATAANLAYAGRLAVDTSNNLFILGGSRVRRVSSAGVITTVAGTGVPGFSGDLGPAVSAKIAPVDIAVDRQGNLYISDANRIRKVTLAP